MINIKTSPSQAEGFSFAPKISKLVTLLTINQIKMKSIYYALVVYFIFRMPRKRIHK